MNWLTITIISTFLFGIYPIFGNRAGKIHGEKINFILDTAIKVAMSVVAAFFAKDDFYRITKTSLLYSLGLGFSGSAFFLMLYAWRIAPNKLSVIMLIIGFSTVISATIGHFDGSPLSPRQWAGAFLALAGIVLVNWNN
jgi:drug/metabolite transporter (DMT)-like permease